MKGEGSSFQAEEVRPIQSKTLRVLVYVRDKGERGGRVCNNTRLEIRVEASLVLI